MTFWTLLRLVITLWSQDDFWCVASRNISRAKCRKEVFELVKSSVRVLVAQRNLSFQRQVRFGVTIFMAIFTKFCWLIRDAIEGSSCELISLRVGIYVFRVNGQDFEEGTLFT